MNLELVRVSTTPASPGGGLITRPADLVELSECVYRSIFGGGLHLATVAALYSLALAFLQTGSFNRAAAAGMCCGLLVALHVAARRHDRVYRWLRRRPALWAATAGTLLGLAHVVVGAPSQILFPPSLVLVGVMGAALPARMVLVAGLLVAAGQASPVLLGPLPGNDQRALAAAAVADVFIPLLFTALISHLACFMLRLQQATTAIHTEPARPVRVGSATGRGPELPSGIGATLAGAVRSPVSSNLTPRQMQALALAAEGLTHAEIGDCLEISAGQVTRLLAQGRRRAGVITTQQLILWAIDSGLIKAA